MPCQWIELGSRQSVGDGKRHRVALAPAQDRRRHLAVDADGRRAAAGDVHRHRADFQREVAAPSRSGAPDRRGEAWRSGKGSAASAPAAATPCTKRRRLTARTDRGARCGRASLSASRRLHRLDLVHAVLALLDR